MRIYLSFLFVQIVQIENLPSCRIGAPLHLGSGVAALLVFTVTSHYIDELPLPRLMPSTGFEIIVHQIALFASGACAAIDGLV